MNHAALTTTNDKRFDNVIPNTVHFVYIVQNERDDLTFEFSELLSIYAAWRYWQPGALYLHTNARPEAVSRARSGAAGKWSQTIFQIPLLQVARTVAPTHADNGRPVHLLEHKSDFVRVQALRDLGSVYLDFDVHPLRDIKVLRESGFNAITGRQASNFIVGGSSSLIPQINSGVFMTKARSKVMELWREDMHSGYLGDWSSHSNGALTVIGGRLVAEPGEMLIMEREAFAPGSWYENDTARLLEVHEEETSNLDLMDDEGQLPIHGEKDEQLTKWTAALSSPRRRPPWAHDWSSTYMLHAFRHYQHRYSIRGFTHVTPRYVLERRSNFARAVYPIARELYENGMIELDDPHSYSV